MQNTHCEDFNFILNKGVTLNRSLHKLTAGIYGQLNFINA